MKIRLLLKVVFLFFGTFLHELAHYAAALVFGRPAGFSVVPRISGESLIFGNVKAATRYKVFSSFIAIAPLVWWPVLYLLLVHFAPPALKMKSLSLRDVLFLWLAVQLLWAGRLSAQDIRTFFAGLFSFSGLLLALTIAALIFVVHRYHPGIN